VLDHLDKHDPDAARLARVRYGCLTSWQDDLAIYGHAAYTAGFGKCEAAVVAQLQELLQKRLNNEDDDDDHRLFGATHNARLIASAKRTTGGDPALVASPGPDSQAEWRRRRSYALVFLPAELRQPRSPGRRVNQPPAKVGRRVSLARERHAPSDDALSVSRHSGLSRSTPVAPETSRS
jgi:hypothetical protein